MLSSAIRAFIFTFPVQFAGWAVAAALQTEKFYDLTGEGQVLLEFIL